MNRLFRLGGACVLATCGALAGNAYGNDNVDEYAIQMNRPVEVGQQFNVRAKGVQQQHLLDPAGANGATDHSMLTITLEGAAKVLSIDTHGRPTAMEYTVTTCTMDRDGTLTTIAPQGATLEARDEKGMTMWRVNGRPASDDVNTALGMFGLFTGEKTIDEMIGTTQPRTIGESWAIDRTSVAAAMQRELRSRVDAEAVFGASTLVDAVDHAGTPCTVVYTQVSADGCTPPAGTVNGLSVRSSTATATFQGIFPKDLNTPAMSNSRNMTVKAVVVDATGAERELNWNRFVEFEMAPAPAGGRIATGAEVEIADE